MPRTSAFDRSKLAELLTRQHGVISRAQALGLGMSGTMVQYRIRAGGPWQALLPGIYLDHTGAATADQRDMAALLWGGPHSLLTGPAALHRFGLRASPEQVVDVLVPAGVQRRDRGFARFHRTTRMPGTICFAGEFRYVLPPRAVVDAARGLPTLPDVRAVIAEAVQRNWCTVAQLSEELAGAPTRGSAHTRQALAEVGEGIRATAEADLRDLIGSARLPAPLYNPRLFAGREFLGMPDCWWPGYGVAAEVDSRAWHFSPPTGKRLLPGTRV